MNNKDTPKISLFNVEENVEQILIDGKFNVSSHKLNGMFVFNGTNGGNHKTISGAHQVPDDLHESDIIIIDTKSTNLIHPSKGAPFELYFRKTPAYIDLMPLDMSIIKHNISTSKKNKCIVVFCEQLSEETYNIVDSKTGNYDTLTANTLDIGQYILPSRRQGNRCNASEMDIINPISACVNKYKDSSSYSIVFDKAYGKDITILENDSKEIIAWYRYDNGSFFIFLPKLKDKDLFVKELITNVLPEIPSLSSLFQSHGSFSWVNSFPYISKEEREKISQSKKLDEDYAFQKNKIENELSEIRLRQENVYLKNLLKATDNELVYSVEWFFKYIGFQDVQRADDSVQEGDIFEEDLRIITEDITYLVEVKGIGGTSTDAQCSQISKIVLRNRKADRSRKYHGVYVVNHQRYKAPLDRILPPFNDKQIEDAEMAYRGMTYTFELFQAYHLIELNILTKESVRDSLKEDGLINFKSRLIKLTKPHVYTKQSVYSFELNNVDMHKDDFIIVMDDDGHWYKLPIISMQKDKEAIETTNSGRVGVKVELLIENAEDFYLLKSC
ncbi:hypothetical protein HLB02_20535 [Serratia nevei]|nr:hypothetical protein [Serratia nevei]